MRGSVREVRPGVWLIRVDIGRDPATGRRRQIARHVHGGKRDAERAAAKLVTEHGDTQASSSKGTFGHVLDEWMRLIRKRRSPTTIAEYERIIARRLKPELGDIPLAKLTTRDFDQLFTRMEAAGLASGTIHQTRAVARAALNQAIKWGWTATNPAKLASPPPLRREKANPPPLDQLHLVIEHARQHDVGLALLFAVSVALGTRPSETIGLQWQDIDWDAGSVFISRGVVAVNNRGHVKETKTYETRVVEIDDKTLALLADFRGAMEQRAREAIGPRGRLTKNAYVFSRHPDGSQFLEPAAVGKAFTRSAKAVGLDGVSLYDLRHLHASMLLAAGVDVVTVSKRLGHANTSTTLNVYAHMMPGKGRSTANLLGELLHGHPSTALPASHDQEDP